MNEFPANLILFLKKKINFVVTLTGLLAVSGCASFALIEPQAKFASAASVDTVGGILDESTTTAPNWPADRWWHRYGDVALDGLIEQALVNSPNLKIAEARVRRAEADAGVAGSASKIQASVAIDSTAERFSKSVESFIQQ